MDETQEQSRGRTAAGAHEPAARPEDAELWLAALVNSSDDAIIGKTLDGVITSWNAAAQQIYGYSAEEVIGRSVSLLIPPERLDEFNQIMRRLRQGERFDHFETVRLHRDGTRLQMSVTISPIINAHGQIIGASTIGRNITERERLLKELAESRRLFQQTTEMSPDAISIYDLETGQVTYVNRRGEQVIGYTPDEIMDLGDRFATTLWHPDDVSDLPEYRRKLRGLADGEISEFEYRIRQPDGTYPWLRSRVTVFTRTADGQVQHIIITTQDITERKQAEEVLRESEARFRSYFELGQIGMTITSPAKGILEVNDEICTILGYDRNELLQMTWAQMTHPDDLAADVAHFNRVLAGEIDSYSLDKRWIRKDGQVIDSTISMKCLRRPDGTVDYFVALLQDITERKQAEEELRRTHAELELQVAERTQQLTAVNEALRQEIAERERTEDELAADLEAMSGLHELSTRLLTAGDLTSLLEEVLSATINMLHADFGNIQLYNPRTQALEIVAQRGFQQEYLDYFNQVEEGTASYDAALQRGERVIVEDVQTDPLFAPHLPIVAAAGYRAVQSTPLFSRSGQPLGMLSTHFRNPHRPSERELRLTDLYARQATEMIERELAEEQLQAEIRERRRSEAIGQQLLQQLVSAQEEERRRISHELHDSLGQYLTALDLGLKSIEIQDGCPAPVADEIQHMRQLALQIDAEVERLSFELRPLVLDDLGLADALRRHVQQWSATSGVVVDLHIGGLDHQRLPSFVETTLYRIVQEALTNILKHAGVVRVSLIIERRRDEVMAIVEDNGRGFDLAAAEAAPRRFGLKSMAERAALAGGRLDIETAPGSGTTIYVHIPLQPDQADGG